MGQKIKRTKFNKFLLFWYVVLVLILPMISLIAAFYVYKGLWKDDSFWGSANFIMYFFFNMPVYIIYTRLVIKEYFPESNKKATFLFIPLVISYTTFFIDKGFEGFWTFLITNSLPLYLGLNLVFLLGLIYLIYINSIGNHIKELVGKIIATLIIAVLIFYAPAYFMILGLEINSNELTGYQQIRSIVVFIFTISLMAGLHYKMVIKLYDKGEL